jgi:REP element-mobilizing transposase RayT
MPDQPLAYFITFTTYGTWLHGEDRGSVDNRHNEVGSPCLEPDTDRYHTDRLRMTQDTYLLDANRRALACEAIVEEIRFREWLLLAAHVRSNHIHLVVRADRDPATVMKNWKARISRRLNQAGDDGPGRKRWTEHGSTKYLWTMDALVEAIDYVLNRQGEVMARYEGPWREFVRQNS